MGEIKSTMDLVMERTRRFSLSDGEKKELKEKEARKKISGLVQKYADGLIKAEEFKPALDRLAGDDGPGYEAIALSYVSGLLSPEADNTRFFSLIETVFQKDTAPAKEILDGYDARMASVTAGKGEEMLRHLKEKHGVSGSAVLPNLMADDDIKKEISAVHDSTVEALSRCFEV